MAIGHHAVNRSEITRNGAAVVIGCGPVGLAIICILKSKGVEAIVASDLSPGRRTLAIACGATAVVDPAEESPYDSLGDRGFVTSIAANAAGGLKAMKGLQKLPVPWPLEPGPLGEAPPGEQPAEGAPPGLDLPTLEDPFAAVEAMLVETVEILADVMARTIGWVLAEVRAGSAPAEIEAGWRPIAGAHLRSLDEGPEL